MRFKVLLWLLLGNLLVASGCDSLTFSEGTKEKPYEYPGLETLENVGNDVFQLTWPVAEVQGEASYEIYVAEMTGGKLEPEAETAWPFKNKPLETLKTTTWQSPKLTFKGSTCYAIRLNVGGVRDGNQKYLCTKHEKFQFAGVQSLGLAGSGKFRLAWAAVPDEDVTYAVYVRTEKGAYDFSAEPYARLSENLFETKSFPLNRSICFLVRFKSKNSSSDANTKELCSSQDGVSDFAGVDSVVSTYTGQALVRWVPSVNPNVKGYNVYQGQNFAKLLTTAGANDSFTRLIGLPPGIRLEFGVRAFDHTGREDDNSKTISVVISDAQVVSGDFPGCVSATALDTNRIAVTVAFPADTSVMRIYRDGILAGTLNPGSETLTDQGLSEATTYSYTCEAVIGGLPTVGTAKLEATTPNVNAPNFAGLEKVQRTAPGSVKLSWPGLGEGPKAKELRVYKLVGPKPANKTAAEFAEAVVASENLVATLEGGLKETTVSGLGDELQYSFAVSACSVGGFCQGQTKVVTSALLEDEGLPKTPGATSVRMQNAKAVISVPWNDSMGALALRKLYLKKGDCTLPSICRQIGNFLYEFKQDFVVSDRYSPPLELEVSGLAASTSYTFAVLDVDPSGNFSTSTASVSVNSGDITPPVFSGVSGVSLGGNAESEIVVSWNATLPEGSGAGQSADGASTYLVYFTESAATETPAAACNETTPKVQLNALSYNLGQSVTHTLTGLSPRKKYAVCVKARDAASNLSLTAVSQSIVTGDRTAPAFLGAQTFQYTAAAGNLEIGWNRASSPTNDVREYRVTLWRCASGLNLNATGGVCKGASGADVLNRSFADSGANTTGAEVAASLFNPPLASNEKVSALVEACDTASPTFANTDNCSASGRVLSLTLPDVDPPAGFLGITSATSIAGQQGAVRLAWAAPTPSSLWSDYAGFKVYTVTPANALSFVKDCVCPPVAQGGCVTSPVTTCDVTGLEHKRTYAFFVRAYDAVGNTTAVGATPYAQSRSATTLDLTPPTFVAALNASFVNTGASANRGVQLVWQAATDNQSASESGNGIVYRIYRSVGSAFTGLSATTAPGNGALLATVSATNYTDLLSNLSASATHHYAVCAADSSNNLSCDALTPRSVAVPRLAPPIFAGIQSLSVGTVNGANTTAQDTTLTVGFTEVVSEAASPATGATDYQIWVTEATPPAAPNNACSDANAVLKATVVDNTANTQESIQTVIAGLTPRKTYSVCVKARDSLGNESVTTAALTRTTFDITPPSFNGLASVAYNGNSNAIDLSWAASNSSDVSQYAVKIWKMVAGVAQSPTTLIRAAGTHSTGTSLSKTDFAFASNDTVRIVVQACDDAAPNYNTANNCTSFADSTARELVLPDVDPPTGFNGVTNVTDTPSNSSRTTGAMKVTWASLGLNNSDWADIRGFRIYNVTNPATNAMTLLKDCACAAYGCTEKLTSCDITGLDAGRTYSIYVRAYDNAAGGGNESLIANPNPISNVRNFRTADLVAPTFNSNFAAGWNNTQNGIFLSWNAATDNQYASEGGNTVGYRLYRKVDSIFSANTRATFESEGTAIALSPDTSLTKLDAASGLVDGKTYYYAICAFDREPKNADGSANLSGNTTCETQVRSATVPDITPPTLSGLAAVDGSNNTVTAATRAAPTYKLKWNMTDNTTSSSQIFVKVRRKITNTNFDFPSTTDSVYTSGTGLLEVAGESGPDDQNTFVNYRVTAEDTAGNATSQTFSIASNRAALPTVFGTPDTLFVNSAGTVSIPVTYTGGAASILGTAPFLAKLTTTVATGNPSCTPDVTGTGLAGRTITLSNCSGNGTLTLSLATGTATDAQSNASSAAGPSATITVDNTAPTIAITAPSSLYVNSAVSYAVSGTCSENGRTVSIGGSGVSVGATPTCTSGTFSDAVTLVSGDGSKSITATTTDAAGNSTTSNALSVTLDTTAPLISLSAPSNGAAGTTGIIFSGSCESDLLVYFTGDVVGGTQTATCSSSSFSASVPFSNTEGLKTISVSQTDLAGNTNASLSRAVYRDQSKPTVTIGTPSATVIRSASPTTFTLSFSDSTGSGVNTVSLTSGNITQNKTGTADCSSVNIGGTGTSSRSVTLSGCTGNGTVSISVASGVIADLASNTSNAAGPSASFTVDNTAPVLAASSPAESTQIKDTFTLAGTCEAGLAVSISSTGIASSPTSTACSGGNFSTSLSLTGADGNKLLTLSQTDAAGNQGQSTRTLVRDTTPPSLSISAPAASTGFNNTAVNTALTGSCESGLTVVLEGDVVSNQSTSCSASSFSFSSWNLSSGDGSKTVTVAQTDAAGNKGTASRLFVLDTTPVPPTSAAVFDSQILKGLHTTVTGQCDSNAAYSTIVTVTAGTATIFSQSCTSNVLTVNLTNMLEGRNSVTLTATVTRIANGATLQSTATFNQQFFCPQGYVGVPGKFSSESDVTGLGHGDARAGHSEYALDPTRDFCVMKYPAKVATSNAGGQSAWEPVYDGNKTFTMANYWPQSRADSTPWVNISRDNAIDRCKALNEAHGLCSGANCYTSFNNTQWGYNLLSNTQWQVIARNLENTGANWTGGSVGSGFLWRGQSDNALASNTDLLTQTYTGSSQKSLSSPRRDSGSDYFGTGNSASQNSSGTAGWQERRRFVLSNGTSIWDFAGNVWQWVADNNNCANTATAGLGGCMGASSGLRGIGNWAEYSSGSINTADKLLFSSLGNYTSTKNAGQMYSASAGGVIRGGSWSGGAYDGLFSADLGYSASRTNYDFGFRCAFLPPLAPISPLDTGAPSVPTVGRVDGAGNSISNGAVTVAAGGLWHLAITNLTDAENTGTNATKLRIKVRRKIANTNNDFPATSDPVYRSGYNSPSLFNRPDTNDLTQQAGFVSVTDGKTYLSNETAWTFNETTGQYARNDGKFVNYRVEVYDPAGNSSSTTFSVENTQSCPPGYVGVPGKNPLDSDVAGLGNGLAAAGNTNLQLDPTKDFCVMKYPAKVMSAGTTAADTTVGGRFEPIMNGNNTFTNTYTYTNSSTFNSQVTYLPSSRYSGTPWVNISRDNAINACRALQMQYFGTLPDTGSVTGGTGFQLMSNTQWQVVARNAELVASNWSGNAVGSGVLARGHSDNTISSTDVTNSWCFGCTAPSTSLSAAPNSIFDGNSYFATGPASTYAAWNTLGASPTAGAEQKRTHTLSNGVTVWDFAGNVWQWVADNNNCANTATAGLGGCMGASSGLRGIGNWAEYSSGSINTADKLMFSSLGNYTSSKNAGQMYGASAGAVIRGGDWNNGAFDGLFSASLFYSASVTRSDFIGFRCAFLP